MRAAMAAESAAIPSVSIVCEGFAGQASATARGHGYDGLPLAVTVGHVDAQSVDELEKNFRDVTVADVIAGLTSTTGAESSDNDEPTALDVLVSGTIDDINAAFVERGWTDGHPVIPPTRERVDSFLVDSGHDPWKTLGTAASSGRAGRSDPDRGGPTRWTSPLLLPAGGPVR